MKYQISKFFFLSLLLSDFYASCSDLSDLILTKPAFDYKNDEEPIIITEQDIKLIASNPERTFVYINDKVISALNQIDPATVSDSVSKLMSHIKNYKTAASEDVLTAIDDVMSACQSDTAKLELFRAYKQDIESGDAVITEFDKDETEDDQDDSEDPTDLSVTRGSKNKKVCSLTVKKCLRVGCFVITPCSITFNGKPIFNSSSSSMNIPGNINVGGTANVVGDANIGGNAAVQGFARINGDLFGVGAPVNSDTELAFLGFTPEQVFNAGSSGFAGPGYTAIFNGGRIDVTMPAAFDTFLPAVVAQLVDQDASSPVFVAPINLQSGGSTTFSIVRRAVATGNFMPFLGNETTPITGYVMGQRTR